MNSSRHIKLRWLNGTLGDVSVTRVQFWHRAAATWQPPINAFRCENGVRICVDLAGVEKSMIDLTVEPQRVVVRGSREAPEPTADHAVQLLALEIDYGPFEREVLLPIEVDVERTHAEQENGLLWITLPAKK
ncbi:MAG: Hsp20/alpha crystallin family protein [Chthoniobacterales bacterium]